MGIDPNKLAIVKSSLEASFNDVRSDLLGELFVFNDGKKSRELEIHRAFIDDFPQDKLKDYLDEKVIPVLKTNPEKRVSLSKGGIEILDRRLH